MKKKFSTKWKASSRPAKQRKYRAEAPLHLKKKFVSINLSKPLRTKVGKRNVQAKKGDMIKVMRGKFKGKTGKILEVKLKIGKIIVDGIQVTKQDGSKAHVKLQPSNLQITDMAERSKNLKKASEKKETPKKEIKEKMKGTKSPTSSAEASSNERTKKAESKTKSKENKK